MSARPTCGSLTSSGISARAPTTAGAESAAIVVSQTTSCVRPARPMPRSLPSSSSIGRTVASITSTMRELFSSSTPFITCWP